MNIFKDAISGKPEAVKQTPLNHYYVYYIDELNGFRYVADKKVVLRKYYKLIKTTETYWVFETAIDDMPYKWKGYKTKEFALAALELLKAL